MSVRPVFRAAVAAIACALVLGLGIPASTASAARDRTPPTTPGNLRVTATTLTSVSVAWDRSTDNSGNFWYAVQLDQMGVAWSVGPGETAFTLEGLNPGTTYTFRVKATDGSGNSSAWSNTATATTASDVTPPTTPTNLQVTGTTPSTISLTWTPSTDDVTRPGYRIFVNGEPATDLRQTNDTAYTILHLAPATTYSFAVQAVDSSGNVSAMSDPVSATTQATEDTTPPTAPTNLQVTDQGCGEVRATWTASTDDTDPPSAITYEVHMNGRADIVVTGITSTPAYGDNGPSTFTIVAVDSSGNASAPSNAVTLQIVTC
jgi:chitodextrinase